MGAVVHVQDIPSIPETQRAFGRQPQAIHHRDRGGIVAAIRFFAGLERGALDLETDDRTEDEHGEK